MATHYEIRRLAMSWVRDKITELYLENYGKPLAEELLKTIKRIPKDLVIWERELKKFKKKKGKSALDRKKATEYFYIHAYYIGKMMAYAWVIEQLGLPLYLTEKEEKAYRKYWKSSETVIKKVKKNDKKS